MLSLTLKTEFLLKLNSKCFFFSVFFIVLLKLHRCVINLSHYPTNCNFALCPSFLNENICPCTSLFGVGAYAPMPPYLNRDPYQQIEF